MGKLRGDAKSMDVHIMMCENRRMWTKFGLFLEHLLESVEHLHQRINRLGNAPQGEKKSLKHGGMLSLSMRSLPGSTRVSRRGSREMQEAYSRRASERDKSKTSADSGE